MFAICNDYRVLEKIGEGSFSVVLKVEHVDSKELYAAKILKKFYRSEFEACSFREINIMKNLNTHTNVTSLLNLIFDPSRGRVTLILELMDINLYEYIKSRKKCLSELKVKKYLFQLVNGVHHLHSSGIFHRDIKPENILLKFVKTNKIGEKEVELVQLGDLGSAAETNQGQPYTGYISTRWYRAPECLLTAGYYGPKMDMWSLGCVYYEMLTFWPIFPGENELDQLQKIHDILGTPGTTTLARFKHRNVDFNFPKKSALGFHKLLPMLSENGLDVLRQLLTYIPESRISSSKLLQHVYFNDLSRKAFKLQAFNAVHSMRQQNYSSSNILNDMQLVHKEQSKQPKQYGMTLKSCTTKSLDSYFRKEMSPNSYLELMKKREKAWGMKPGIAKNRLLQAS